MSQEQKIPSQETLFPETYPPVDNQTVYERELIQNIGQNFPEHLEALQAGVKEVVKHTKEGAGSSVLPLRNLTSFNDEYPDSRSWGKIVGELPDETVAIMGGIYALTEANVVSDKQREEFNPRNERIIVRKGNYHGKPVFFKEIWYTSDGEGSRDKPEQVGQRGLMWEVAHEAVADPGAHMARKNPLLGILMNAGEEDPAKTVDKIKKAYGFPESDEKNK